MIKQLPTLVPQEKTQQQSNKSCLKHGNIMYPIVCHMKAFPVFIPKYSLYFPWPSDGVKTSVLSNPVKTGNTPEHIDPHLNHVSWSSTSSSTFNSSPIHSKRNGTSTLGIITQSKKTKLHVADKERGNDSTSIFDLPSDNTTPISPSANSLQFPYSSSSDQSGNLGQTNEKSLNKADYHGDMYGINRDGKQPNNESSVGFSQLEETQSKSIIEDYTQFACYKPIYISAIRDYSGFLTTETPIHSEKQAIQSSLVNEENPEKKVNLNSTSIEEREEGEISSCDSLPGDLDSEHDSVSASITNLSNDKTAEQKNRSIGNNKMGETTLPASHSKNSSTIDSDAKKWPNDLFESDPAQSPSNTNDSKFENSSPQENIRDSRYENSQTAIRDENDNSAIHNEEKNDYFRGSDDDYDSEYRQRHRHRHRSDHDYERDQQSRRHSSRSYSSKRRHSKEEEDEEDGDDGEEEESTSQSDLEEENSMLEKLRKVSHLWRKKERWLSKFPSEEGEVPIENVKKSFFTKEGIDLLSKSSLIHSS